MLLGMPEFLDRSVSGGSACRVLRREGRVVSGCDARGRCLRPFTWTTLDLRAEPRSEAGGGAATRFGLVFYWGLAPGCYL